MKKNIAIIALLILSLIGAFSLKSQGQERDKCPSLSTSSADSLRPLTYSSAPPSITILGDETTISYTGENCVIKCDNDQVFNLLFRTHGTLFKRFTCSWKTDRHGRYKHYTIYLSKGDGETIQSWAKNNL
jgi:hypothetical protein